MTTPEVRDLPVKRSDLQQRIYDRKATQLEVLNRKLEKAKRAQAKNGAERSLFVFSRTNPLRRLCVRLATSKRFDAFIITAIIANSIIIGLSDFNVVDNQLNPASHGVQFVNNTLVPGFSMRNYVIEKSELPFTSLFAAEAVIKIIAFGFVGGHGTYIRDSWNKLDFFVVFSSFVSVVPNVPNVSFIRTIRVLRPLRSLSMIPGMRRLISALLQALPALGNVLILQLFVFTIFGILGIQLFGGNMNKRCRLTEFAIKLPMDGATPVWPVPDDYLTQVLATPEAFRCLPQAPMLEDGDPHAGDYTMETSPWFTPQHCFWPVDNNDLRLCVVASVSGDHTCHRGRTCGSNFDTYGNPRFTLPKVMDSALYNVNLNWAYTTFDNLGMALFTIFKAVSEDGWTTVMYMTMDSGPPVVGAFFFVILLVIAFYFVMNLLLAVISDEFQIDEEEEAPKEPAVVAKLKGALATQRDKPRFPKLFAFVSHPWFGHFILVVILANTIVLSLDHYPAPASLDANVEIINFAFSSIFLLEMILKLVGLGLRLYVRDKFNQFDAFVVTMSVLEIIASPPSFMTSGTQARKGAVSILRAFRLFRVFKLARSWGSFRELLALLVHAVASIGNFAVLFFLFIYVYALIGMQFFANTMRYDGDGYLIPGNGVDFWQGTLPRNNFDTLLWSAVTVFQVISGENWSTIMMDTMRGNGFGAAVYFIILVILGTFIMLNLFLALLLANFDDVGASGESVEQLQAMQVRMASIKVVPIMHASTRRLSVGPIGTGDDTKSPIEENVPEDDDDDEEEAVKKLDLDDLNDAIARELDEDTRQNKRRMGAVSKAPPDQHRDRRAALEKLPSTLKAKPPTPPPATPKAVVQPSGKLFFFIDASNPVRQWAYRLIIHPWFEGVILALIVVSSIALALDNPLEDPDSSLKRALAKMDRAFTAVFLVEMVAKIVALGLFSNADSYFRKGWNILDGFIVVTSLIMLATDGNPHSKSFKSFRSLRGLRTFRPLRMISRRPGLRLVVNALFEAIPNVLNVLFLCLVLYFIFSIIAVTYLKGLLYSCQGDVFNALSNDQVAFLTAPVVPWSALTSDQQDWFVNTTCAGFATLSGAITSRYVCGCWGATWDRVLAENFDNVGNALLTFFEISTTEGWADIMMAAVDATDIDMQPIRDNNMNWSVFFCAYIMVGSYFVVNLFVGVIIENFNKMKHLIGQDFMLSDEQKRWLEARKAASRVVPKRRKTRPKHRVRGLIYDLVRHRAFEWFIIICIIVNTVLMGAQYFGQPTAMTNAFALVNSVFAAIFTAEAVLKITAYGRAYFDDPWSKFDFFVVAGTLFSILIEAVTGTSVRSVAMLVRAVRVARVMRLIRASKSIRQILLTLYLALPGLSNIASLLFLMLFIYAAMGMQFFAKVKHSVNIDEHANFQTFWRSCLFLLRAATGEAWNYCMHDLAVTTDCIDDPPYDPTMCGFNDFDGCVPLNGCGSPVAFLYFCSFTLFVTYVMLNLTIAIVLESFSQSQSQDSDDADEPLFEPEMLEEFQLKWAELDTTATGFLALRRIRALITLLEEPLGRKDVLTDRAAFLAYMHGLALPVYDNNTIYFRDVLLAMARELVKEEVAGDPDALSDLPTQGDSPSRLCMEYEAHDYYAVRVIEKRVRQWLDEKRHYEHAAMEAYKLKIKKQKVGRPKKVTGAKVYTITDPQ